MPSVCTQIQFSTHTDFPNGNLKLNYRNLPHFQHHKPQLIQQRIDLWRFLMQSSTGYKLMNLPVHFDQTTSWFFLYLLLLRRKPFLYCFVKLAGSSIDIRHKHITAAVIWIQFDHTLCCLFCHLNVFVLPTRREQ